MCSPILNLTRKFAKVCTLEVVFSQSIFFLEDFYWVLCIKYLFIVIDIKLEVRSYDSASDSPEKNAIISAYQQPSLVKVLPQPEFWEEGVSDLQSGASSSNGNKEPLLRFVSRKRLIYTLLHCQFFFKKKQR